MTNSIPDLAIRPVGLSDKVDAVRVEDWAKCVVARNSLLIGDLAMKATSMTAKIR